MARQVYRCPDHGEFELNLPFKGDVPLSLPCIAGPEPFDQTTACGLDSPWVPSAPNFSGGPTTGAGKGD